MVELETLPPLRVKGPMPVLLFEAVPACAMRETSPAGVPLPEATPMVKSTGCPCTCVMGLVVGVVESERVVVVVVKLDFQLFTKFATLTEPNPVAKS